MTNSPEQTKPDWATSQMVARLAAIDWPAVLVFAGVLSLGIALALYATGASTGFVYDDV